VHACAEDARADAVRELKIGRASAGVGVKDTLLALGRGRRGGVWGGQGGRTHPRGGLLGLGRAARRGRVERGARGGVM